MENRLLDVNTLAPILCLSPRTLRNKLCAEPANLPPRVAVPGIKGPRWRLSDVQKWIASLQNSEAGHLEAVPKSRPGRRRQKIL